MSQHPPPLTFKQTATREIAETQKYIKQCEEMVLRYKEEYQKRIAQINSKKASAERAIQDLQQTLISIDKLNHLRNNPQ